MRWLVPSDLPACRSWAELELLGARVFADLERNGVTNAQGEPRRLLGDLRQLRQVQLAYERELGMTPASRLALRVDDSRARNLDVAAELAELHRERTERETKDLTPRASSTPNRTAHDATEADE
jgi:hypothetical protein